MQCYVEIEFIDGMGRETKAFMTRKGQSQVDIMNKCWKDFHTIARSGITDGGIETPNHITVSAIPNESYDCYSHISGQRWLKGAIRTLAKTDNGYAESEYRLDINRKTGEGTVSVTDWKYWG